MDAARIELMILLLFIVTLLIIYPIRFYAEIKITILKASLLPFHIFFYLFML